MWYVDMIYVLCNVSQIILITLQKQFNKIFHKVTLNVLREMMCFISRY